MANSPGAWGPYSKDCSQGYCSYYCPQWCFFLFPPPPPSPPSSRPFLSPLLIAVITVASTAFVLVAYYLIVAHYRRRQLLSARPVEPPPDNLPSHAAQPGGLDEALIDKIASHQYRAGGGLVLNGGSDCAVCLSEFEDGDHIRLLPKCGHAFHRHCVDTWLKSHCNCPLCRAAVFPLPAAASAVVVEGSEDSDPEEITGENVNFTDGNVNFTGDNVVEIGEGRAVIGRSLSMDSPFRRRTDTDTDTGTNADSTGWGRTLYTVLISPVARMKRSRSLRSTLPT